MIDHAKLVEALGAKLTPEQFKTLNDLNAKVEGDVFLKFFGLNEERTFAPVYVFSEKEYVFQSYDWINDVVVYSYLQRVKRYYTLKIDTANEAVEEAKTLKINSPEHVLWEEKFVSKNSTESSRGAYVEFDSFDTKTSTMASREWPVDSE